MRSRLSGRPGAAWVRAFASAPRDAVTIVEPVQDCTFFEFSEQLGGRDFRFYLSVKVRFSQSEAWFEAGRRERDSLCLTNAGE